MYSREELIHLIGEADTAADLKAIAYILKEEEDYWPPVHFTELSGLLELKTQEVATSHLEVWQMILTDIRTLVRV